MPKRKVRKSTKQPKSSKDNAGQNGEQLDVEEKSFNDDEVERQITAIRALRDMQIEQLRTMLRIFRSSVSKDQLEMTVSQFFKENLPNLSISQMSDDGKYEVKWKDADTDMLVDDLNGKTVHASLLQQLSMAYPGFSAGIPPFGGFEFSNKSVKTGVFDVEKLQIRNLVFDESFDSQMLELKDGLQTPNVNNNRLSVGATPKTLRLPKYGEMLLSVHGSPLGVYKEENMETIQESEGD